jgi:hypothetical protein
MYDIGSLKPCWGRPRQGRIKGCATPGKKDQLGGYIDLSSTFVKCRQGMTEVTGGM